MDLDLRDKCALVSGGGSGIGAATARLLAEEGARVAILDVAVEAAAAVAASIEKKRGTALAISCDVSDPVCVDEAVARVRDAWKRIDILINCAGVLFAKPFLESDPGEWRREVDVNLYGVLNLCRATLPSLRGQGEGRIVSVASDAGRVGERGMATYAAAKAGIIAFSKSLAREVGQEKITVNVVCPGSTKTPMLREILTPELEERWVKSYPLGRLGEPEDIANAIAFLASKRAGWITGQAISVNGGFSMA
ncbi:MAG: SDR family NAD(P)-dependent oxidoreductase [Vicinamibacteria bacterium]